MAITCALTSGFDYKTLCKGGAENFKNLYFCETKNQNTITVSAANVVTAMTLQASKVFRKYILEKETVLWTDDQIVDVENGTLAYQPTVTFTMKTLDTVTRNEIHLLASNYLMTIGETYDGVFYLLGYYNGMEVVTGTAGTTTALGKGKMVITIQGKELKNCPEVTAALMTTLSP